MKYACLPNIQIKEDKEMDMNAKQQITGSDFGTWVQFDLVRFKTFKHQQQDTW